MERSSKVTLISFGLTIIIGILIFMGIGLVSAETQTLYFQKLGGCIDLPQTCSSCTYVNLSSVKLPDGSLLIINTAMEKNGANYNASFCNTSQKGIYTAITCGDKDNLFQCTSYDFTEKNYVGINIILLLFFIGLLISFIFLNHKVNYEKWYANILKKYESKNYVKLVVSSLAYNLLKHPFGLYYLFGFPIMILITDIVLTYNINSILSLTTNLFYVYSWGFILVGIMLFGQLQEFVYAIIEDITNMSWGFTNG